MRVAFLTNFVSPYRRPLLERLSGTPGWDLRVFVNARSEFDRAWEVDTSGLSLVESRSLSLKRRAWTKGAAPYQQVLTLHLPLDLHRGLDAFRPDVILSHELGPRSVVAAAYARLRGVPLVLWSYQSRVSAQQGPLRGALRRGLLRQAACAVGMGSEARDVLAGWGVPQGRIFDAPNATDHETLSARLADPRAAERQAAIRGRWPGKKLALVVGRLVALKGTERLLESWGRLPAALRREWQLVFLGSGPQAAAVDADPQAARVDEVSPGEVADWLAACDLHVFPSLGDVWGLVVNEALHCGAPTLCSSRAACAADLIGEGRTGLVYDPAAPDAHTRLAAALAHPDLRGLAARGREHVAAFGQERMAEGFRRALRAARSAGASPRRSAALRLAGLLSSARAALGGAA